MKNLNQKGVVDYLFVVALVLVVGVAFFVFSRVNSADKTVQDSAVEAEAGSNSTLQKSDAASKEASNDEVGALYDSWERYETTDKTVSVAIPDGWVVTKQEGMDLIKSNAVADMYKAGMPATITERNAGGDGPNQFIFYVNDQSNAANDQLSCEKITVNEFNTRLCTAVVPADYESQGLGDVAPGHTVVEYELMVGSKFVTVASSLTTDEATEEFRELIDAIAQSITLNN